MKRSRIKPISDKRSIRSAEVRDFRARLVAEAGRCMVCDSRRELACHEILNGGLRDKTLDEPCSLLVVCWNCNSNKLTRKGDWPVARQLAILQQRAPQYYDLKRFNWLRNPQAPNYVTQEEVDDYQSS